KPKARASAMVGRRFAGPTRPSPLPALAPGGEPVAESPQSLAQPAERLLQGSAAQSEIHLVGARFAPESLLRALEGEALVVEQALDAQHQFEVFLAVETLAGGILLRPEQLEFGLPVAQHVGRDLRDRLDLSDP